ncbi:MAG: lytic transglycosylase domain-containing protein [Acidobacteriota bacterium]
MKPRRVPFTVSATMLFLMIAFNSTPSDTAIPDPNRVIPNPSLESDEIRELAQWVVQSRTERPRVFTDSDLDAALTRQPQRLGLLSPEAGQAARREQLAGLPYGPEIWRISRRHGVDGLLVASIIQVESHFTRDAVSSRGAVGLMQVLPATGALYGATDLNDPHVNLDVGCRYLGRLLKDFDGDLERAVAAYNAGPSTVARYGGVPPFRETKEYVRRVLELYRERSDAAWERAGAGRDPFAALSRASS